MSTQQATGSSNSGRIIALQNLFVGTQWKSHSKACLIFNGFVLPPRSGFYSMYALINVWLFLFLTPEKLAQAKKLYFDDFRSVQRKTRDVRH